MAIGLLVSGSRCLVETLPIPSIRDVGPLDGLHNRFNALWRGFEADVTVTKGKGPIQHLSI